MKAVVSWACLLAALSLAGCAATPPVEPAPSVEIKKPAEPVVDASVLSESQVMAAVDRENSVFFQRGVAVLEAAEKQKLQQHAARLKADRKLSVTLIGYTDDQGSRAFNLAIAEKRVNTVYQLLRSYGATPKQLRRYSVAGEKTSKSCSSLECRELMRRVEIVYRQ